MKIFMKCIAALVAVVVVLAFCLFVLQWAASERVEVVELHTTSAMGEPVTTRVWVVDDEGYQYLRVGSDGSGWFDRMRDNMEFEVTRAGVRKTFRSTVRPEKSDKINELMQAKYTWGDSVIAFLVGSREGSLPIELHPI